jgi:hypothetical protein
MMKKKRAAIIVGGLLISFALQGCSGLQEIQYQGKQRQIEDVEEMLADYLESENPDLDFEVNITQGTD